MRFGLCIVLAISCLSCSTMEERRVEVVSLPKMTVAGVFLEDGLQEQEVGALSRECFRRYVSGCGMPDKPTDDGRYWRVQLWGGYVGIDYGTLLLRKDGSEMLLEAPSGGFRSVTRHLLRHQESL